MNKKLALLIGAVLAMSQTAYAANNEVQSTIDSFINCDSGFFHQLKNNSADFKDITTLEIKDDIAYIPVNSISSDEENSIDFLKPINYRGLKITGYQNIHIETPFLGQYYYWGLIIDGTTDQVKQALNQINWQPYNSVSFITNAQIYERQDKKPSWKNNPYSVDGVIPHAFTVEKSLTLEPINEDQVHLICSIQGDMNTDILYAVRPDMKYIDEVLNAERQAKIEKLKLKNQQKEESSNTKQDNSVTDDHKNERETAQSEGL